MSDILRDFDKKNEFPKVKLNLPKFDFSHLTEAVRNMNSAFDNIVKDIREQKDNAMAMEFTKCIGELLRKNGVIPKITEYTREHVKEHSIEQLYGVSIDELDFSEHDKVFEDKIADLQQRIRELIKEKDEYKRKCNDFGFKNQELKKDYKTASELLGKYQRENESLKKRMYCRDGRKVRNTCDSWFLFDERIQVSVSCRR